MYSLLPIKSEYDPPVNFNEIAKSITGSIAEDQGQLVLMIQQQS